MTLTWLYPVLAALGDGHVLRRATAVALTVLAWGVVVGGAIGVVAILRLSLTAQLPLAVTVGGILWTAIFAVAVLAMHQVFRYHVRDVDRLAEARFVAIPLAAILFRVAGEQFAVWAACFGAGGFVLMLVAGPYAGMLADGVAFVPGLPSPAATGLLGAVWFLATCAIVGAVGLAAAYLAAEGFEAVADIANHVRVLAARGLPSTAASELLAAPPRHVAPAFVPPAPPAAAASAGPPPADWPADPDVTPVLTAPRTCRACGIVTGPTGARFCDGCGARL